MKKLSTILSAIAALIAGAMLCACAPEENGGTAEQTEIEQGYSITYAFTVPDGCTQTTMKDYMDVLKEQGALTFEGQDGDYGFYITSVLGISNKTVSSTLNSYSGYDWAVYTTLTEADGVPYASADDAFVYGGITLYKASYGVSGLPCAEGHTYALVYEYSSMTW